MTDTLTRERICAMTGTLRDLGFKHETDLLRDAALKGLDAEDTYHAGFEDCREMAVEAAEVVSEKYMTAARKARDEEDDDLFEDLESKAVAVSLAIEAISALTPNTESEPVADSNIGYGRTLGREEAEMALDALGSPDKLVTIEEAILAIRAAALKRVKPQDNPQSTEPVGAKTIEEMMIEASRRPVPYEGLKVLHEDKPTQPDAPIADEGGDDAGDTSALIVRVLRKNDDKLSHDAADLIEQLEGRNSTLADVVAGSSRVQKALENEVAKLQRERDAIASMGQVCDQLKAERDQLQASNDTLRAAVKGLLQHPGIADADWDDKDPEDHAAEAFARKALSETGGA